MKTCPANGLECRYTFCLPGVCSIQEVEKHKGVTSCDNTMVVAQSPQPSPGYSKEQMGEAFDAGFGRADWKIREYASEKLQLKNNATEPPDRETFLSSLPKVKDAGVLVSAITRTLETSREYGEQWPDFMYRIREELKTALTQYNNPDAAAT